MASGDEISSLILQQFPQPSRALRSYDENAESDETTRFTDQKSIHGFDDHEQNISDEDAVSHHNLRKFVERLDEKGRQVLKKLVSEDVRIERLLKETLREFRGIPVSDVFEKFVAKLNSGEVSDETIVMERGLDVEEMEDRLERFKVKTVNIVGIGDVKEDDKP